jgi:hypothetical protein
MEIRCTEHVRSEEILSRVKEGRSILRNHKKKEGYMDRSLIAK